MAKKGKYYQRPDGLFETIRTINGKRVAFRGKTCREVDKKILAYQEEAEKGRTVSQLIDSWFSSRERQTADTTNATYTVYSQSIRAEIGHMYVSEVKPVHCMRILEQMANQGYKAGTVSIKKSILKQVFRYAVICGDIEVSPAECISLPRGLDRLKRDSLTMEQIKAISEYRGGEWWLLGVALLWTGCRRGELLALRYEDIDRKANTITINKKLSYIGDKPKLERNTKTEAGMRTIPLLYPLANALPKDRIGLIFSGPDGSYLTRGQYTRAWNQYRKDVGLPEHITAHYLRHTFATICYNAGVDPKEAASVMGHANEHVTMAIYTHLMKEKQSTIVEKLEAYAAATVS